MTSARRWLLALGLLRIRWATGARRASSPASYGSSIEYWLQMGRVVQWGLGSVQWVRTINTGERGIVMEALLSNCPGLDDDSDHRIAVKRLVRSTHDNGRDRLLESASREATLLDLLQGRHVVRHVAFDSRRGYIGMQHVERDLFTFYQEELSRARFEPEKAAPPLAVIHLVYDLLAGLSELHGRGYAHQDIKLDNLLVHCFNRRYSKNCHLLIADFDSACSFMPGEPYPCHQPSGSERYVAPEVWREVLRHQQTGEFFYPGNSSSRAKSDIWSAGVVVYSLLLGQMPPESFRTVRGMGNPIAAVAQWNSMLETTTEEVNDAMVELVRRMLHVDPVQRCTAAACLEHLTEHFPAVAELEDEARQHFKDLDDELQLMSQCLTFDRPP